jgi:hypothetical protein
MDSCRGYEDGLNSGGITLPQEVLVCLEFMTDSLAKRSNCAGTWLAFDCVAEVRLLDEPGWVAVQAKRFSHNTALENGQLEGLFRDRIVDERN